MIIEVIAEQAADILEAEKMGADRIELVSAMKEGGLTPSYGTLKTVLEQATIPVQIMVRPHGYSFTYDETDWLTMKEDISVIKQLGGNRIVFGCITPEGKIDEELLTKVIEHVPDFDISFHRAFDEVSSQTAAYKVLCKYKKHVKRILTSGGKPTASEGANNLRKLVELSKEMDGPDILPGSGVTPENIATLHEQIGANQYHIGSGVRMEKDFSQGFDQEKMNQTIQVLK